MLHGRFSPCLGLLRLHAELHRKLLLVPIVPSAVGDIKVIAGGVIPPQDYDYLRDAGVQGIYGPGSNVVECAADVLRLLGHNMPPLEDAAA